MPIVTPVRRNLTVGTLPQLTEALSAESELGRDAEPIAKKVETAAAPVIRDEDMPPQQKISDSMKDRLRRELESQGANPNKSAGNPILVVAAVVAVLVVIGGQGEI